MTCLIVFFKRPWISISSTFSQKQFPRFDVFGKTSDCTYFLDEKVMTYSNYHGNPIYPKATPPQAIAGFLKGLLTIVFP